jgi:hypothetical protein
MELSQLFRPFHKDSDAKCIERARKRQRYLEKWGRWAGAIYITLGIAIIATVIGFICMMMEILRSILNFANPAGQPQPRDLILEGFALGITFGIGAGFGIFKGAVAILEGIHYLRGDQANRLLLHYYDSVVAIVQSQGVGGEDAGRTMDDSEVERKIESWRK